VVVVVGINQATSGPPLLTNGRPFVRRQADKWRRHTQSALGQMLGWTKSVPKAALRLIIRKAAAQNGATWLKMVPKRPKMVQDGAK